MVQLRTHPLTHAELVNALSFKDPVYREEEDAFLGLRLCVTHEIASTKVLFKLLIGLNLNFNVTAWFSKTPTCRRKQRALELELEQSNEANESQKKKKGGK